MKFTVYRLEDGKIVNFGSCPAYDVHMQAGDGEIVKTGISLSDEKWRFNLQTGEPEPFSPSKTDAEIVLTIIREREKRLSVGFDYDFGDARGMHRIGTTEDDRKGWDDVSDLASALIDTGNPDAEIQIVTDTGPVAVTAAEWKQILLSAAQFRQPIWAASFALQAMNPIPQDIENEDYWQ